MKQTAIINSEIKARCADQEAVRHYLHEHGADFKGTDHQIDTYFDVPEGRLKLRQGPIENNLIFYQRADTDGPKQSTINLSPVAPDSTIGEVLTAALGVRVVVDKQREIYFIDNVKFHIDTVKDLGNFVEIEAIDANGKRNAEELEQQCSHYMRELGIKAIDLVVGSYSDLLEYGDDIQAT